MKNATKLYILDTFALIYRAHFALHQYTGTNSKKLEVGALLGLANSLVEILQKRKPTHIIAAFDSQEATWRKVIYPAYKAQRQIQPEAITKAIPYSFKLLKCFGIPYVAKAGYEADDIIGTLALQAVKKGFQVYIVSPDKDLGQLVQKNISIYKPASNKNPASIWQEKEVLKQWGIPRINLIPDMLALWGDSSDNIPGVPTIGKKTAQKLMQYGSLEEILIHDDVPKKLKERLETYKEQAILSKKLATIKTDVDLSIDLNNSTYTGFNTTALRKLLHELEFYSLAKRLLGTTSARQLSLFNQQQQAHQEEEKNPDFAIYNPKNVTYQCLQTEKMIRALVEKLKKSSAFCFDTETSQSSHRDLVGISFCYKTSKAYYIPIPEDPKEAQKILKWLQPVFDNPKQLKIGQNIKFDILVLTANSVNVQGPFFDTMIAHHLVVPTASHNLTALCHQYLKYDPIPIERLIGEKGKKQSSMRDVPLDDIVPYACEDADVTWQIYQKLALALKEEHMEAFFYELEMKLLPILVKMEQNGIAINTQMLHEISVTMEEQIRVLEKSIYQHAGYQFNIASPKQLGSILFDKLKIDKNPTKTATGQYATHEGILKGLKKQHPIVEKILGYRELQKLKSTYVDALPSLLKEDGRLHTSFQQGFVSTGRLSSARPNLQNIPIRTERGREIRKAFVAKDDDYILLSADYSQIELRIMAHFAEDKSMIEAFKAKKDIHIMMGARIFKIKESEVTPEMRRIAKTTNFGLIYGISAFGLSRSLGISRTEASHIIKTYFEEFPGIKNYTEIVVNKAKEKGYVTTLLGRKRPLPDITSQNATIRNMAARNAINMPIQGTAAELIQKAMIDIDAWLVKKQLPARMILQVHDELIFEVHKEALDSLQKHIPRLMEKAMKLRVPIDVNIGIGKNWLEAH